MNRFINILILTISFAFCSAQTIKIEGKLILQNEDDRCSVTEKTQVVLEQNGIKQSTFVNNKLEFFFEINGFDKMKITTIPRGIGNVTGYVYDFSNIESRKSDTIQIEIPYSLTCKYDKSKNIKTCPICNKVDKVIPIVYGLIVDVVKKGEEAKKKAYKSGGCVITGCDPNWYCERDKYEF